MAQLVGGKRVFASSSNRVLAAGDLAAFLIFVILGQVVHNGARPVDWLTQGPRIAAPFLFGWMAAALVVRVYPGPVPLPAPRFLLNSLLALLLADLIAFALRAYLFVGAVTWPFALTALAFTTLFVVGWRLAFLFAVQARSARVREQ